MLPYTRRIIPANLQDIPAIETWLADLAGKGLFLVSSGSYSAKFERAEPAKATYRLEPTANILVRTDPDNKRAMFYKEFGWEYVCTFGNYFHVYRSMQEDPPEIHTDPKELSNAFRRIVCAQAFSVLFCFGLLLYFCHSGVLSLTSLIKQGFPLLLAFIVLTASSIADTLHFFRLYRIYRGLKSGTPLEHSSDYRNRLPLRYLQRIVPAVSFAIILFIIYGMGILGNRGEWQEIPEAFPIVSLMEMEQEGSGKALSLHGHAGIARFRHTFLAPEQYILRQDANISGRRWAGDGSPYDPSLVVEIYCLRFPALAEPFLQSLTRDSTRHDTWETEVLEGFGAEKAYLCTNKENPWRQAFFRTGDTVISVDYRGDADIRPFLPEFAALAQADFSAIKP